MASGPPEDTAAARWRLRPWVLPRWRELDGERVLHEASSGDVHLLDAVAAALLERLWAEGPATEAALAAAVAREAGLGAADGAVRAAVAERLEALAAAGLVERCP